jgi:hypothetical protein
MPIRTRVCSVRLWCYVLWQKVQLSSGNHQMQKLDQMFPEGRTRELQGNMSQHWQSATILRQTTRDNKKDVHITHFIPEMFTPRAAATYGWVLASRTPNHGMSCPNITRSSGLPICFQEAYLPKHVSFLVSLVKVKFASRLRQRLRIQTKNKNAWRDRRRRKWVPGVTFVAFSLAALNSVKLQTGYHTPHRL